MRVNKAKRKLLKWYRYTNKTKSHSGNSRYAGYHVGLSSAYSDVMYANRYVPIGVRTPYLPRWVDF